MIGIIEKDQIANQNSYNLEESTNYHGNGYKYPGNFKEGSGFRTGDIVETIVNLSEGCIQWIVNNEIQAATIKPRLSAPNKKFVPYIDLGTIRDCVEWVDSKYI